MSLRANVSYVTLEQSGNKKIHQWENVPESILVNSNQREGERRKGGDKWDHRGLFLAVNPHLAPVPLAYPAVLSLWGTAKLCQQLSCLVPLIQFNTRRRTHQTPRAMQDPHPPPFTVFQRKWWRHENMKMLFTGVCEGGNFHHAHVYFLCRGK